MIPARLRIEQAMLDDKTEAMLLDIRKTVIEETVSMNPSFDYEGLDDEIANALINLAITGERHRGHLTRYARGMAGRFIWLRQSGWK